MFSIFYSVFNMSGINMFIILYSNLTISSILYIQILICQNTYFTATCNICFLHAKYNFTLAAYSTFFCIFGNLGQQFRCSVSWALYS
jgi:hypothetical protein